MRSSSTAAPRSAALSSWRGPETRCCSRERATSARCAWPEAQSRGTSERKLRPRSKRCWPPAPDSRRSGRPVSRKTTAADHAHDLDHVARTQRDLGIAIALDDLTVVLDRDRSRVDANLCQLVQQPGALVEVDVFAVDLQRDHLNSVMAA